MKKHIEEYLGPFVYGAIDGTVTTFAVVAASAGAGLEAGIVVILGLANLIGDGFSMGASSYLSAKSEQDLKIKHHKAAGKEEEAHDLSHGETPMADGTMTFASFVAIGFVPLVIYVGDVLLNFKLHDDTLFLTSAAITALTFVAVGLLKAQITETGRFRAASETLILGGIAAALSYVLGDLLGRALGMN
jgi:vacuolar iron transporter family protein